MDLEKLLALISKYGLVPVAAIYFMFKLQGFMETQIAQNATVVELLRQLVEAHK